MQQQEAGRGGAARQGGRRSCARRRPSAIRGRPSPRRKQRQAELYLPYVYLEQGGGLGGNSPGRLFGYASTLVRAAAERPKPNTQRLREYSDNALPRVLQRLTAPAPVYPELEKLNLSFDLERMREWLGPDAPIVRQLLSKESPDTLAAQLVDGTKLADPEVRKRLWEGGAAAIDASQDPMIVFARSVDPQARAVRKSYEDEVEAPVDAAVGKYRAGALQGIRHQRAAGCQLHPAPEFRHRAGLERAGTAGRALHAPVAPVRARHRQGALQGPGLAG